MNMNASHHYFVGLDAHLRFTAVCILDANGKVAKEESIVGHSDKVCQFLCETLVGTFDVVLEACDGYGIWHERLKKIARRVVVAWIDDVSRFSNAKKIGAYFGLVVSEDSSGDKQRQGRITREGPGIVRQLLVEAVWRMHRYDPTIRGWVSRLMRVTSKPSAGAGIT